MRINQLIKHLELIREERGNLQVDVVSGDFCLEIKDVNTLGNIAYISTKPIHNSNTDRLKPNDAAVIDFKNSSLVA